MTKKNGPRTKTPPFIMLPLALVESDAFRSLSISAYRVLTFLWREHMRKGGQENGKLNAPHRQLVTFGVSPRLIEPAISHLEEIGLVECNRGAMRMERVATTYRLMWLDDRGFIDTTGPNPWRAFSNPALASLPQPKIRNLPPQVKAALPPQVKADGANLPPQVKADRPKTLPPEVKALSRCSYQGGDEYSEPTVDAEGREWRAVHGPWPFGFTPAKLRVVGS
jgi:hypothetical protein